MCILDSFFKKENNCKIWLLQALNSFQIIQIFDCRIHTSQHSIIHQTKKVKKEKLVFT